MSSQLLGNVSRERRPNYVQNYFGRHAFDVILATPAVWWEAFSVRQTTETQQKPRYYQWPARSHMQQSCGWYSGIHRQASDVHHFNSKAIQQHIPCIYLQLLLSWCRCSSRHCFAMACPGATSAQYCFLSARQTLNSRILSLISSVSSTSLRNSSALQSQPSFKRCFFCSNNAWRQKMT